MPATKQQTTRQKTPYKPSPSAKHSKPAGGSKQDHVIIFDTTLRDGEQSPGFTLHTEEKIKMARQLERLNVDVIEAGFAIASQGDFDAIQAVSQTIRKPVICSLARALPKDIERAGDSLKYAKKKRIHTFIATSSIHVEKKLKLPREKVIELAVDAVKQALTYTNDVEFSCEDAGRTDWDYICAIVEAAIEAGATTVNIPDTVGYTTPQQYGECIAYVKKNVPNIEQAVISVHCHDDLGMAVANSLAGVVNGARQVECTINGIGERAGNCSLEEIVMALKTRKDFFGIESKVVTEEIFNTSRLLVSLTGMPVQANKAIVGANAFAHEAGIHQDGVLKERSTYEIMTSESVGWHGENIILGKHSGRHAFRDTLKRLGCRDMNATDFDAAFGAFMKLCDKKKKVYEDDIMAIIESTVADTLPRMYELQYINVTSGTETVPTATVRIGKGDEVLQDAGCGDGPVDAAYKTIERMLGVETTLLDYHLEAITGGKDALGRVTVRLDVDGRQAAGQGSDTDVIVASVRAFLNALNKIVTNPTHDNAKAGREP
ncbi:2-isopropylmalate synthase [Candidatus Sumerlaeota bacterium]|nr:2-isopropylmalate synthase [Candidatus Sumerlaeota bacterium]